MMDRVSSISKNFVPCPSEGKILSCYEGQFDCVYILLHPFLRPRNIDFNRFRPASWPSKQEIINDCDSISWQEILEITDLKSISEIDIGLRTSIRGLKEELSNQELCNQLAELETQHIIHPEEGNLPPLLENRLLNAIKAVGHNQLWVCDEFGENSQLYLINDLLEKDVIPCHGCVFTSDNRLLVTTHWDSHCSFLCSSREIIEQVLSVEPFEGFYCTPKTEVYWGVYEI